MYVKTCLENWLNSVPDHYGKTDPTEIDRTYNSRNQQTWFFFVYLSESMEKTTIIKLHRTSLRGILLSEDCFYLHDLLKCSSLFAEVPDYHYPK